jgi:hypothetical protein
MRLAAAIAVIAVAWASALYVHQRTETQFVFPNRERCGGPGPCTKQVHPSWADPAAVFIAIGGLAVAAGIVRIRHFAKPS